jgi:hypothetical protein
MFPFLIPSHHLFKVETDGGTLTRDLSAAERQTLSAARTSVQISASDARRKALDEQTIRQQLPHFDAPVVIRMHFDESVQAMLNVPAAWSVLFSSSDAQRVRVWVDASSGKIVKIDESE